MAISAARAASTSASSRRSAARPSAVPPASRTAWTSVSTCSDVRLATNTLAPSRAKARAPDAAMPVDPATSTTLPSSRPVLTRPAVPTAGGRILRAPVAVRRPTSRRSACPSTRRCSSSRERSPRTRAVATSKGLPSASLVTRRTSSAGAPRRTPRSDASGVARTTGSSVSVAAVTTQSYRSRRTSYSDRSPRTMRSRPGNRDAGTSARSRISGSSSSRRRRSMRITSPPSGSPRSRATARSASTTRVDSVSVRTTPPVARSAALSVKCCVASASMRGRAMNVPRPWWRSTTPRASRSASARRRVDRPTSNRRPSSRSGGSREPGGNVPSAISPSMIATRRSGSVARSRGRSIAPESSRLV